jgi:hypothetical protein
MDTTVAVGMAAGICNQTLTVVGVGMPMSQLCELFHTSFPFAPVQCASWAEAVPAKAAASPIEAAYVCSLRIFFLLFTNSANFRFCFRSPSFDLPFAATDAAPKSDYWFRLLVPIVGPDSWFKLLAQIAAHFSRRKN